jgi:hypothetical protein
VPRSNQLSYITGNCLAPEGPSRTIGAQILYLQPLNVNLAG